jgi:ElaB/YqjD/DUF883 family membrane-anchored ribosome-binding protein
MTWRLKGEHIMPNETMPADEFGHNHHDVGPNASTRPGDSGSESSFRDKAQEYLGGERVREFADAAADRVSATADYLRNTGATRMREDVEKLVKSNPGPAILVAATVGVLIGRSLHRHSREM